MKYHIRHHAQQINERTLYLFNFKFIDSILPLSLSDILKMIDNVSKNKF